MALFWYFFLFHDWPFLCVNFARKVIFYTLNILNWLSFQRIRRLFFRRKLKRRTLYLLPGRGDVPAFTPAEAGTRLSDPGGMQGWVDLVGWLHTVAVCPPKDGHPSNTNRAQCTVTSFMRRTTLAIAPSRQPSSFVLQELIRRWDSERELLYNDNIHVEASAYAHWTDLLISTKYLW